MPLTVPYMTQTRHRHEVGMPEGGPIFRRHVWQTPVSREVAPARTASDDASRSAAVPVWVFLAARKILGDGLYDWLKAKLKRNH